VAGGRQGTQLRPLLFLVMINDLEIASADGNVIFVDDTITFEIVEKDKSNLAQTIADEVSLCLTTICSNSNRRNVKN
jgi:hypothetical protein